jgi:hypothetical protein
MPIPFVLFEEEAKGDSENESPKGVGGALGRNLGPRFPLAPIPTFTLVLPPAPNKFCLDRSAASCLRFSNRFFRLVCSSLNCWARR